MLGLVKNQEHGFSMVELVVAAGITSIIALAIGGTVVSQKTHEIALKNKMALTFEMQNIAHKVNSSDFATRNFNAFRGAINPVASFDECVQKQAAVNCVQYANAALQINFVENVPISNDITLQTQWTSSLACVAAHCSSFSMIANVTLVPKSAAVQASMAFNEMQHVISKNGASLQRNYPLSNLVPKKDLSYVCANNPNQPISVIGLDPDNVTATCGQMTGNNTCNGMGNTPLASFGGATPNCQSLVSVSCSEGLSMGGFYEGACSAGLPSLSSYYKVDAAGNVTSLLVCSGMVCVDIVPPVNFYANGKTNEDFVAAVLGSTDITQMVNTMNGEQTVLSNEQLAMINNVFTDYVGNSNQTTSGFGLGGVTVAEDRATEPLIDPSYIGIGDPSSAFQPSVDPSIF